jgi:hypothetical protein
VSQAVPPAESGGTDSVEGWLEWFLCMSTLGAVRWGPSLRFKAGPAGGRRPGNDMAVTGCWPHLEPGVPKRQRVCFPSLAGLQRPPPRLRYGIVGGAGLPRADQSGYAQAGEVRHGRSRWGR